MVGCRHVFIYGGIQPRYTPNTDKMSVRNSLWATDAPQAHELAQGHQEQQRTAPISDASITCKKQEIVSKASFSDEKEPGSAIVAKTSVDDAAEQRQREEEEWTTAKRIMEEEQEAQRRQLEGQMTAQQGQQAHPETHAAAQAPGSHGASSEGAATQDGDFGGVAERAQETGAVFSPAVPGVEVLETMSKKDLVVFVQQVASVEVLQANQLSGNPSNVAKRTSKDKVGLRVSSCAQTKRADSAWTLCI